LAPPKKQIDPLTAAAILREKQQKESESAESSSPADVSDFDPLSKDEIEDGIKKDKMSAELLRRSREVVSTRALAGKSWLERTFSQGVQKDVSFRFLFIYLILY